MYALLNEKNNKFFRRENEFHNCIEVANYINAKTFKTKKDAEYANCLIKGDYIIVSAKEAKEMNILY